MTGSDTERTCDNCKIFFTKDMELEESGENDEIYCSPDCATDAYYSQMRSSPITFEEMKKKRNNSLLEVSEKAGDEK